MSDANIVQHGGTHYKVEYQHWDFVAECELGYFEGQITKYVCRHRKKAGLLDLDKAGHFVLKLMELHRDGYLPHNFDVKESRITRFVEANGLNLEETNLMRLVSWWETRDQLAAAYTSIQKLKTAFLQLSTPAVHTSDSEGGDPA